MKKLIQLDHYLKNTQDLFEALVENNLEEMNHCLNKNRNIMKMYDQTEQVIKGSPQSRIIRERMERIAQINQQCLQYAEERCLSLQHEIESTEKNRLGILKYGVRQRQPPRFIDNRS